MCIYIFDKPLVGYKILSLRRYDIPVVGENIVSIDKNTLHPLQKRYHMESGYDEDFVICPTLESIRTGKIPLPFRVNHHQYHPTHELLWIDHALDYKVVPSFTLYSETDNIY